MTEPWSPNDEQYNPDYYYTYHTRTVKAQIRYFQRRYQTYGRRVRVIAYPSGGGLATGQAQRRGEAIAINADIRPFAIAILIENAQHFSPLAAEFQIPSFGWNEDIPQAAYTGSAPYFWSFMPDQETESKWAASFICRKLWMDENETGGAGTAKFTNDPTLRGQQRKFGLIWVPERASQRGPFMEQLARLLKTELRQQCGIEFTSETEQEYLGNGNASTTMAKFKRAGVTTVICYCVPQIDELHVPALQNAATALNYFPEWYWDHVTAMDRALWQQEYGDPKHQGFGVSFLWRQPAFRQSYAYQAYLQEEPGTVPNLRFNFEIYHVFLNLFSGIQAAGPNLTPETIKRGMFTFRYKDPDNPWVPTGGYGDSGPSPYTFIHTAMAWWYDPTGTPPGGSAEGCVRVLYDGRRYYGENPPSGRIWPAGDVDLRDPAWPCTEDERRMTEAT